MEDKNKITYFAETDFRNKKTHFGIKASDRLRHVYIIGKTGMGKSTLLENMAAQDVLNGNGVCFIDPHGSAVDTLLDYVPENRVDDVVYFSPADVNFPIAFNVMEDVSPDKRNLIAQGLLSSFKKIWGEETFSDRMEHILNNTLLALLEYPDSTMLSIPRIFIDTDFQKDVIKHITDPSVKNFWAKEYASWDDRYRKDAYSAVLNKVGQFTSNPVIRNIVGQPKSTFDFRKLMDEKKILLVNLSIGQVGESNANLLGSMMTTKIFLAAMSRADSSKDELSKLPEFYLYIDEFQNLANDSFADILSQARKYKLALTMAHQYVEQMPEKVRSAVFGNVGTTIAFRIGSFDAEIFEKEFSPVFFSDDLVNLDKFQIYLRLMIDGAGSAPFSALTLPPIKKQAVSFREEVFEASRKQFARPKEGVEKEIYDWNEKNFKVVVPKREPIKREQEMEPKKQERVTVKTERVKTSSGTFKSKPTEYRKNLSNQRSIIKKAQLPEEKPALEGLRSLKEALDEVMKNIEPVNLNQEQKREVIKKQVVLNKEIQTENRSKLKEALAGVAKDIETEKEQKEEVAKTEKKEKGAKKIDFLEDKPKEVSEELLKEILK
ncbi:type IV secretion system DNA-binding domain-containing protein [Patescibacteria group bacterium]|nr:type IV secretion system DNA-binding domain-containing protein [Patescibacteria group bacterium]MCG2694499.1 type IV secretion system DNA-binding domain-containing protein [Candidatus Parcubacteria bacterium]